MQRELLKLLAALLCYPKEINFPYLLTRISFHDLILLGIYLVVLGEHTRIWREKIRAARMRKTGQWNFPNRAEPYLKKILTNFKNYLLVPFVLQLCQFCLIHTCTAVHTNKISVLNTKRWYGSCNKVDKAICNTLSITMLQRVPLI